MAKTYINVAGKKRDPEKFTFADFLLFYPQATEEQFLRVGGLPKNIHLVKEIKNKELPKK